MDKKKHLVLALTLAITGNENDKKTQHCQRIAEELCVGMSPREIETCKSLAVINAESLLKKDDDE